MCRFGNDDSIDLVERVCETVPEHINAKNNGGETPLHLWSFNGRNFGIAEHLLKKGADINAKNNDGKTPIMWAYAEGRCNNESARFLLHKGANLNCQDKWVKCVFLCAF